MVKDQTLFRKSALFLEVLITLQKNFKRIRKEKEKARAAGDSDNRQTERTPRKCLRCGSVYHLIAKCPKTQKENEKWRKQVYFNEKGNHTCNNSKNNSDQKIYASIARMSGNCECTSEKFGDSSQLTNWILDSVSKCHMTPEISDFIPGSLEDMDKYVEVADRHQVTAKKKTSTNKNVQQ